MSDSRHFVKILSFQTDFYFLSDSSKTCSENHNFQSEIYHFAQNFSLFHLELCQFCSKFRIVSSGMTHTLNTRFKHFCFVPTLPLRFLQIFYSSPSFSLLLTYILQPHIQLLSKSSQLHESERYLRTHLFTVKLFHKSHLSDFVMSYVNLNF